MLKKANKYIALSAVCMLTISACSTDEGLSAFDDQDKTPIELSAGVVGESPATQRAATRAMVTSGSGSPFAKTTSVYMVLKSENRDNTSAPAFFTRTIGYLEGSSSNAIKYANGFNRYWEDSYSRNSQVSAYAACVPGYYLEASVSGTVDGNNGADIWSDGSSEFYKNEWAASYGTTTLAWPLSGVSVSDQSGDFVNSQDLCFSNNVSDLGSEDKRLKFVDKKFTQGNLVFNHALTRITFKIKRGDGFTDKDDFAFTESDKNIVLTGFNTSGTFDFKEGEFQGAMGTETINKLAVSEDNRTANGEFAYVLDGIMLPGTNLNDETAGSISFTIDDNLYQLSKKKLLTALDGKVTNVSNTSALDDNNQMRPGVHYVFTMTVGKKKVSSFTASVVEWESVTTEVTKPTNARITMSLLDNGIKKTGDAKFDLYRSTNTSSTIKDDYESYDWTTGYTLTNCKAALVEGTKDSGIYQAKDATGSTDWYWPDNKTFYHFRAVMPNDWVVTKDNDGDYISLAAGFKGSYTDVCWGAPFAATISNLIYDPEDATKNGFDGKNVSTTHQLFKAIGPTEQTINMIMFHMMSEVTINLTTTDGTDKVDLANAKMQLSNIYSEGKVLMGNGLVVPTGAADVITNETATAGKYQTPWTYGFIPQSLENVVLTITTADNNLYIVDMKDVLATTVDDNIIANPYSKNSNGKYVIDRWLPNYKYTYTFKLSKAGITQISASLANWEEVVAGDDNVQIK